MQVKLPGFGGLTRLVEYAIEPVLHIEQHNGTVGRYTSFNQIRARR